MFNRREFQKTCLGSLLGLVGFWSSRTSLADLPKTDNPIPLEVEETEDVIVGCTIDQTWHSCPLNHWYKEKGELGQVEGKTNIRVHVTYKSGKIRKFNAECMTHFYMLATPSEKYCYLGFKDKTLFVKYHNDEKHWMIEGLVEQTGTWVTP